MVKNKYTSFLREMPQTQRDISTPGGLAAPRAAIDFEVTPHFVTFVGKTIFRTTDGTDAHRSIQAKELLSLALSI